MNSPFSSHALLMAAIAVLIFWRVIRRIRRLVGRQRVRTGRLTATSIVFPLLLVGVALSTGGDPRLVEGLAAGVAIGIALALAGLRLTRFEHGGDGASYTPNTVLGVAISLLFVGRVVYRLGVVSTTTGHFDPSSMQAFGRSPLTLATFGLVAAYFASYSIGILVWHRRVRAADPMSIPGTPAG